MKLLAEAVRQSSKLIPQVIVHPRVLAQLDDEGVIEPYPAKGWSIGAEGRRQDERVPTVVLRPGHGEPVAEAIELLRIEGVHVAAALHEGFHQSAPRDLDGHAQVVRLAAGPRDEPVDKLRDCAAGVGHTPLGHTMPFSIENADLMRLRRPIDADEPAVQFVLRHRTPPLRYLGSRPAVVVRHPCTGARSATPHWACTTALPVEAQVPRGRLEAQGSAGRSRRGGRRLRRSELFKTLLPVNALGENGTGSVITSRGRVRRLPLSPVRNGGAPTAPGSPAVLARSDPPERGSLSTPRSPSASGCAGSDWPCRNCHRSEDGGHGKDTGGGGRPPLENRRTVTRLVA